MLTARDVTERILTNYFDSASLDESDPQHAALTVGSWLDLKPDQICDLETLMRGGWVDNEHGRGYEPDVETIMFFLDDLNYWA